MNGEPERKLLIGLSPRILRQIPADLGFQGKTLQYLEQSVAHWVMALGELAVMVPTVEHAGLFRRSLIDVHDYVATLDGLILQGGADIDPHAYGESPVHTHGAIDIVRDRFELDLIRAFAEAGKPVFGICRGMQLINVAFGGTLYQDLQQGGATKTAHSTQSYDEYSHRLRLARGSWLSGLYDNLIHSRVNSIHHQGVKTLGNALVAEAWSDDGVIEAIRGNGDKFIVGVQWHPEFHDGRIPELLPPDPLMHAFLEAAGRRRRREA